MAKSPRAEQLSKIRDLLVLARGKKIETQKQLEELAVKERIFVKDDGTPWKYSRVFQYTDGLHWLGFSKAKKGSGQISLSPKGEMLAQLGEKNYKTGRLDDKEKHVLIESVFSKDYVQENFIKYFSPTQQHIRTASEFRKIALPVYVRNIYQKKKIENGKTKFQRLCDIQTEHGVQYKEIESTEFLHTIKYWFRDLDLIDDLNISPTYKIELNYLIFPIKLTLDSKDAFLIEGMIKKVWDEGRPSLPIPVLLYRISKEFFMPVDSTKALIEKLFHEKPDRYYLSRAPKTLLDIIYEKSYMCSSDGYWRNEMYFKE